MSEWESTTIIGKRARRPGQAGPRSNVARTQSEINAAKREGMVLSVDKKQYTTGNSKLKNTEGQRLTKVDRETDIVKVKKIDPVVSRTISKIRTEKKMSQKELATKVNEKPNIINDYESGRATANQQVLGKLERALGVRLRGKDVGEPLGGPKKK
ncbi:hypothetical protein KAFR_0D01470 [Kazachstania africana CBS 2517]|uniref:HTH cro/C1-type domain-containing protein n=1 Tax=Kazachstania africana (strain ATCC 22294 / BCRC 22015 / CBS 2517 / CECT 1963 / NBRC 1671 / NRRL Y-8276) TaxID=1071382 RepID=H2ATU3_KAZAF|nr:hypothetical protein KAFR_0D01470 [Kazachstania africana CBS 2517]CCF57793.1 hypothetical protein KAFR_0D01470 [Kazachstania africana CBS 2517]